MTVAGYGCIYASETTGVHDRRWVSALTTIGLSPRHISRDQFTTAADFVGEVEQAARGALPVVAGPLALAEELARSVPSVVFLSWGFDLQEAAGAVDLRGFAGVIVDSSANESVAQAAGASRILRIPWGLDLASVDLDERVTDLTALGVTADEPIVLSLRAHEPRYRVADVIEAFAENSVRARLVVGNSGSLTAELRTLATDLDVPAVFLPPVEEAEVIPLLRRADAYVTASDVDGTSVTLLQAMASRVPIAASANAGNVDWIKDGISGYLFPVGDGQALRHAIQQALSSTPAVTRAARQLVENRANWAHNVQSLRSFLTEQ